MALVAWTTIIAPVVALGTRFTLPAPGVILFIVILSAPLWIAGYALLVTAVATGMLRRRGALRVPRHRKRATAWGWLTSAGAMLLGVTLVDFDERGRGAHSGLTLVFGSPTPPSTVHDVSLVLSCFAAAAWLIGYGRTPARVDCRDDALARGEAGGAPGRAARRAAEAVASLDPEPVRHARAMAAPPTRASAPGMAAPMALTAWVLILAPLVALALKLPSFGWSFVFFLFSIPLWLGGYAMLVACAARAMLRARGVLREGGARRVRATVWAWLTSIGVMLFGFTLVDGGDSPASVQSTLTLLLGAPLSPSLAHEVSAAIAYAAVAMWVIGWFALLVEWSAARQQRQGEAPRVAPPVVPNRD